MSERICRRCLLRDVQDAALYQTIRDYVENLPAEQKADAEVYESRLRVCRACDSLTNGMCALCGCFVEARAAKKALYCPKVPAMW